MFHGTSGDKAHFRTKKSERSAKGIPHYTSLQMLLLASFCLGRQWSCAHGQSVVELQRRLWL